VARIIDIAIRWRTVTSSEASEATGRSWSVSAPFRQHMAGDNAFGMSVQFVRDAGLLNGVDIQSVVASKLDLRGAMPLGASNLAVLEAFPERRWPYGIQDFSCNNMIRRSEICRV
jgi:hypothetical protein